MVPKWADSVERQQLRNALFNGFVFINAKGGTGGGLFRYMFSRFLRESAVITGLVEFADAATQFQAIGDAWEDIGDWFHAKFELAAPEQGLEQVRPMLLAVADQEEAAWQVLAQSCKAALSPE